MKKKPVKETIPEIDVARESIILGHLVKYNLYLLAKSIIFSAVLAKSQDVTKAIEETELVITELDLDSKRKAQEQK